MAQVEVRGQVEIVLSFHHVGPEGGTQVSMVSGK